MPQIVVCAPPSAEQFLARAVTNEASLRRCTVETLDTLAPDGRTAVVLYRLADFMLYDMNKLREFTDRRFEEFERCLDDP